MSLFDRDSVSNRSSASKRFVTFSYVSLFPITSAAVASTTPAARGKRGKF